MLEPAVRPTGVSKSTAAPSAAPPFENRDFESLLHEARQTGATQSAGTEPASSASGQEAPANPPVAEATNTSHALGPLSGLGTIENATLRQIMAGAADPPTPPKEFN